MSRVLSTEEFIQKARKVHGNRYDYSKVVYKNSKTKVTIICRTHGEFLQTPDNHYSNGCPVCGRNTAKKKLALTTEEFIQKARKVHGNKYDYSKVRYKRAQSKVTIICRKHGEFNQMPDHHLRGHGCQKCGFLNSPGRDRSNDLNTGYLYLIKCKLNEEIFCKIGTTYDTKQRFKQFPFEVIDSLIIPGIIGPLSIVEEKIKKDFTDYRYIPTVKFGGCRRECFLPNVYQKILLRIS